MGRLSDKTTLITGGTTGIGFATAQAFIAEGARVMITGQDETRLHAAAQRLGDSVIALRADVRSLRDLDTLAARVKADFGGLDVLFANAGVGKFAPLESIDENFFDTQFDVNVKGVFFTVQRLQGLLHAGGSVILNASAVHEKGSAAGSVYFATKAAVRSFARTLAAELAPRGIRVNAVSPGLVFTDFQGKMGLPAEALAAFADSVKAAAPLGREGQPSEIAQAVVFLASGDASYITGADLGVDGGFMHV